MRPGRGKTKSDVWYTMNSLNSALLSETLCFSNVFKYIVLIHCIVCDVFIKQILTFDTCIWAFRLFWSLLCHSGSHVGCQT